MAGPAKGELVTVPTAAHRAVWKEGLAVGFLAFATALLIWIVGIRSRRQLRSDEVARLKEDLVSNLSHELFTPLTPVVGYAQLLAGGRLSTAQVRHVAKQMMVASEQLEHRIDTLVTYATLRRGDVSPGADAVDVASLIGGVAASRGEDRVSVRVAEPIPVIRADDRLLRIALGELIDNAVKFSPEGGEVEVTAVRALDAGGDARVMISVADRGIGMDEDALAAAFGEFQQFDASSTRRFGGVGLGLTLADGIARLHGGEVVGISAPGRGSVFTLWIPEQVARSSALPVRAA
ncbi:MAG: sensor histidine kinase [Actinomycetota bacterium]